MTQAALHLLLLLLAIPSSTQQQQQSMISIRGGPSLQKLPTSYVRGASVLTFDPRSALFTKVEDESTEGGFVNPTGFSELFLPADLPMPRAQPALGVCIASGVPRYIMPSAILWIETPDRQWRNRGACSAPRASCWIDSFSSDAALSRLTLSAFGQSVPDVRHLEDIDGASSFTNILINAPTGGGLLGPPAPTTLPVLAAFESLKAALRDLPTTNPALSTFLSDGFHFVDVPISPQVYIAMPRLKLRMFLSDFDKPQRLLEVESVDLDGEAVGEMEIRMVPASAGRESEFLPEGYADLYDEGNIIFS